jgi:PAS domain S-box-containing protein
VVIVLEQMKRKIDSPYPDLQVSRRAVCRADISPFIFELLDALHGGIMALDEASRLIFINRRARKMLGEKADDAVDKPASLFIDDDDLLAHIAKGAYDTVQSYVWQQRALLVTISRLDHADLPHGCLIMLQETMYTPGVNEDVNQLKGEFTSLLENSYDGIILADGELILNVNASFGRITGLAPTQLVGKKFSELDTESHICLGAIEEVIRLTRFHKKNLTLQRRLITGNEIFVTGNPIFDRQGQVNRVLLNVRDVTDLKSLEDQIKNVSALYGDFQQVCDEKPSSFRGVVAESPAMRRLLDLVLRVSRVDSTVLLQGPSGVGKDVFARLLYRLSARNRKPFVSVNCGAIPETLLESEFFGYKKGAFTNADPTGKVGLFEQANHGILFLDEVGELPLNLQVKLLQVIQDRCCRRLGDIKHIDLDVRIMAATNRDLRQMVSEGLFRADLFYRLYVVPIDIPALNDRREDILPLSLRFLNHFNAKYKVSRTLGHELMSVLESYDWPGNVRELQNVVERMVVTADAEVLTPSHLPDSIRKRGSVNSPGSDPASTLNLKEARERLEYELIKRALMKSVNTREAAKLLGVDHSTVVRKAQRYQIDIRRVASHHRTDP